MTRKRVSRSPKHCCHLPPFSSQFVFKNMAVNILELPADLDTAALFSQRFRQGCYHEVKTEEMNVALAG